MELEHRVLADAVVLIALGTLLITYATVLLAARNPDRRVPWYWRGAGLVDGEVATTLQLLGFVAAVWGGTGLERSVGMPLAPVLAIGPAVLLQVGVRWLHHRRLGPSRATVGD